MRDLPIILSLFHIDFDKFNNTGSRMLDSIHMYQMTLKLFNNRILAVKTSIFYHLLHNVIMDTMPLLYVTKSV